MTCFCSSACSDHSTLKRNSKYSKLLSALKPKASKLSKENVLEDSFLIFWSLTQQKAKSFNTRSNVFSKTINLIFLSFLFFFAKKRFKFTSWSESQQFTLNAARLTTNSQHQISLLADLLHSSYKISPRSTCADQRRQTVPGLTPLTCSVECLVWLARCPAGRSPAGWRHGPCTGRHLVSAALLLSKPSHRSCPAAGPAARPEGAGSPAQNDESWIQMLRKTRIVVNYWYSKVCTSVI